jgi:hypothetical protein
VKSLRQDQKSVLVIYTHKNGTKHNKIVHTKEDLDEIFKSPFVEHVQVPMEAFS